MTTLQELLGPLEGRGLVDPDRVDLGGEDVADGADDHVRFLVDRRRRLGLLDPAQDDLPEPQQVGQVAGQLALGPFEAGGADDEAQALGRIQLVHDLAELAALAFVDDLARDADAVQPRHEHQIAAGDADVGRERRPLGADAFLDDLDQHLVAAAEDLLDRRLEQAAAAAWSGRRGPARRRGRAGLRPGRAGPSRARARRSPRFRGGSPARARGRSLRRRGAAGSSASSSPPKSSISRLSCSGPARSSRSRSSRSPRASSSGARPRVKDLDGPTSAAKSSKPVSLSSTGDEGASSPFGRSRLRPRRRRRRRPSGLEASAGPAAPRSVNVRGSSRSARSARRGSASPSRMGSTSRSDHSVPGGKTSAPKLGSAERNRARRGT